MGWRVADVRPLPSQQGLVFEYLVASNSGVVLWAVDWIGVQAMTTKGSELIQELKDRITDLNQKLSERDQAQLKMEQAGLDVIEILGVKINALTLANGNLRAGLERIKGNPLQHNKRGDSLSMREYSRGLKHCAAIAAEYLDKVK
jgi:hypothetical protein